MKIIDEIRKKIDNKRDLTNRIYKIVSNDLSKYTESITAYQEDMEENNIYKIIRLIYNWYFLQTDIYCQNHNIDNKIELLNLSNNELADIFNINELFDILNEKTCKRQVTYYDKDHYYKEKVLTCVMYDILEKLGPTNGPINGLIFAYMHNLDLSIPMQYAFNENNIHVIEMMEKYVDLNGKIDIDYFPYYYYEDDAQRFYSLSLKKVLNKSNCSQVAKKYIK